jgi:hypothetical protein
MKKRIRPFTIATEVAFCAIGFYFAAFVWYFDVLSAPTRSWDGWLGPRVRNDSQAIDIGSVWHTDAPNRSLYRAFTPLCYFWLRVQGLSLGA